MKLRKPDSNLVKSWTSLENLMTFAKEHFLVFRYPDGNITRFLSIRKFSSTRWIGLILQSEKLIKAEQDVKLRASKCDDLGSIVEGSDWEVVKE